MTANVYRPACGDVKHIIEHFPHRGRSQNTEGRPQRKEEYSPSSCCPPCYHVKMVTGKTQARTGKGQSCKSPTSVLHTSALLHGFQKECTSVITAASLRPGGERQAGQGFHFMDEKMKFKVHPASHNRGRLKLEESRGLLFSGSCRRSVGGDR